MARHRNIRNCKSFDYDDDYDLYGQSYEDDYGVSPGTLAQYSYSRSIGRGVDFSSYMPSEETVEEEVWEDDSHLRGNPSADFRGIDDTQSGLLNACVEEIRDVVGENYSERDVENAALKCKFDHTKAIDFLLTSPHATTLNSTNSGLISPLLEKDEVASNDIPATSSIAVPMPQRTTNRGRRSKNSEANILVITKPSDLPKSNPIPVSETKTTKVETNSHTPVKTGFHMPSNSPCSDKLDNFKSLPSENNLTVVKAKNNLLTTPTRKITNNNEGTPSTPGKQMKNMIDYKKEYEKRTKSEKQQISMVVIGHVDAGKSTMMGHLLYQKGVVSKRIIHKYEQESKKLGKASFAYAWVLDETGEERSRGVTMDVAHNNFETENRIVTLMDAPGHRDFIPNMIAGASQADVAVLVVGSSTGEFEAGFGIGGQTREHALLVRSLGVAQLAVAINKLDTVGWSVDRFNEIVEKLKQFLKLAGFRDSDVTYIPVSGLLGENLVKKAKEPLLCSWYKGPCLLEVIDKFRSPQRPIDFSFRFCVNDVFRGQGSGLYVSGKIESGGIAPNTKVIVMPAGEKGLIKGVEVNEEQGRVDFALAGEHATLILHGVDIMKVTTGSVICDVDNPIRAVTRLRARIIVFNIEVPITRGFPVELHYKAVSEPAVIRRLLSQLHKSTGEVIAKKPKVVLKGHNALVEVEVSRPVCLEEYSTLKELGRFTLRYGGSTIAACVVTNLL